MTFLSPLFFLGALALVVPVIIHLTHREKKDVVEFPSLMFLRRIPYRSVRRQKLRHLLLFALRCLALLLLVLAFARPFFESPMRASASSLGPREIVLLVDNSYSMGYRGRLAEAKTEARSRIQSLGPDDRVSLIVFSNRAEIMNQPTSNRESLLSLVDAIELSDRTTRYEPAFKLAKKVMDESDRNNREVVLVSDFQRNGWEGDEDVWLPAGTTLIPVNLSSATTENLSVTEVVLERDSQSGRERLTASARVAFAAPADALAASRRAHVELNGRSLQSKPFELNPNTSSIVSFEPLTLPAGVARGTIRIDDDDLVADDAFHFVVWPGQALSVLLAEGSPGRAERQRLYIERALEIGDRPSFSVVSRPMSQLRASDLTGKDVVVLNDVSSISDGAATMLDRFVRGGGGLILVLGEASGPDTFSEAAARLLPARPAGVVDRARDFGGTLSYLDYGSPVFELFSAPHSGDFSSAKFFRYRSFATAVGGGVLARFDDGAPALIESKLDEGRILVWSSTLDTFWNDLARQPVFLPFVHQLVKYTAGYTEASLWHSVGEVTDLTRYWKMMAEKPGEGELLVTTPSSETRPIVPDKGRPLVTLDEQGFYEIRLAGATQGLSTSLASNLDLTESDLATLDPQELVAAITFHDVSGPAEGSVSHTPAEQENRQTNWWYLLVAAFAILACETILSNRLSRSA
ncbi:MAG TPA: BatA domain-containing protein [Vicinamibacteria bacterium]|nr:BatA domain-containing protein [Vicinamibacteria bacterium]